MIDLLGLAGHPGKAFLLEQKSKVAAGLRGCGQVTLFGLCLSALLKVELLESIDFRGVRLLSSCHS